YLATILFSIINAYVIYSSKNDILHTIILTIFASAAGSVLSFTLSPISVWVISIAVSIYDIYAVFRGPIKKIIIEYGEIKKNEKRSSKGVIDTLRGAVIPFRGISLGMGDAIFYSMICSTSLIYPYVSFARALVVAISITIGNYITLRMLEKKDLLPAMPIPTLMAIMSYLLSILLKI
ncbi:MAG TPA: hypothetical protein ENG40_02320, partial [Thermoprotei archaeon]|nr:hypothetical protein [Thermoprotei archaeon]